MSTSLSNTETTGSFVTLSGERYYAIGNVDKMAPFFISMVKNGAIFYQYGVRQRSLDVYRL